MYFEKVHNIPHFHVIYNEFEASISIPELKLLAGNLPSRVYGLVMEWAIQHTEELLLNWNRLKEGKSIIKIPPLT